MDDKLLRKHKSTIFQLYMVLIASLIGSFIPNQSAQILSLIFLILLMIAVPVYQAAAPAGSLLKSHMRYLNGTIWAGSTFLFLGMAAMGLWMYLEADPTAIHTFFENIQSGMITSEAAVTAQAETTMHNFVQANLPLLIRSGAICLAPPTLYILYRIIKALSYATTNAGMNDE